MGSIPCRINNNHDFNSWTNYSNCWIGYYTGELDSRIFARFWTLANMVTIGFFIDLVIFWKIIPMQTQIGFQMLQLVLSIIILGAGVFLYLKAQLGAGPRDGLMVALTRKFNKPVSHIRVPMDIAVSSLGYLLGGPLWIGTVITALTLGYCIQIFFKIGKYDSTSEQLSLQKLYQIIKKGINKKMVAHIFIRSLVILKNL